MGGPEGIHTIQPKFPGIALEYAPYSESGQEHPPVFGQAGIQVGTQKGIITTLQMAEMSPCAHHCTQAGGGQLLDGRIRDNLPADKREPQVQRLKRGKIPDIAGNYLGSFGAGYAQFEQAVPAIGFYFHGHENGLISGTTFYGQTFRESQAIFVKPCFLKLNPEMLAAPDQQEKARGNHYPAIDILVGIKQDGTDGLLVRVKFPDKSFRIPGQIHGDLVHIQVDQIHIAFYRSDHLKGQCPSFLHQNSSGHGQLSDRLGVKQVQIILFRT